MEHVPRSEATACYWRVGTVAEQYTDNSTIVITTGSSIEGVTIYMVTGESLTTATSTISDIQPDTSYSFASTDQTYIVLVPEGDTNKFSFSYILNGNVKTIISGAELEDPKIIIAVAVLGALMVIATIVGCIWIKCQGPDSQFYMGTGEQAKVISYKT